jgi:PAS domain S-box-containing protein
MARQVGLLDWASTPLGPAETWPESLRVATDICLRSRFPMAVLWGQEMTMIYNDGYRPVLALKHPAALGRPAGTVWPEIWPTVGPMLTNVLRTGLPCWFEDLMLVMDRRGYPEECHFTFSYSPVRERDTVAGIFVAVQETTSQVLDRRRRAALNRLLGHLAEVSTEEAVAAALDAALRASRQDVPTADMHLAEGGRVLLPPGNECLAESVARAIDARTPVVHRDHPGAPSSRHVLVLPLLTPASSDLAGVLSLGINPRIPFDDSYRDFLKLIARHVVDALTRVRQQQSLRLRMASDAAMEIRERRFVTEIRTRRDAEDRQRRKNQQLEAIVRMQQEVAMTAPDPAAVTNRIAECAAAVTNADGAAVWLAEGREMVLTASNGLCALQPGARFAPEDTLAGECLSSGVPQLFRDIRRERSHPAKVDPAARSLILVPLIYGEHRIGVLVVTHAEPNAFADDDLQALQLAAGLLAASLSHAMAFEARRRIVADRTEALAALAKSEEHLRALNDCSPDGVFVADVAGDCTYVNRRLVELIQSPASTFFGKGWRSHVHPDDLDVFAAKWSAAVAVGGSLSVELRFVSANADTVYMGMRSAPLTLGDGRIIGFVGTLQDLTDRVKSEMALRRAEQQLRDLAIELQTIREGERARIAREIHDELGQSLTALKMELAWVRTRLPQQAPELTSTVTQMLSQVDGTIETVRRIATELRPHVLDTLGLIAALEWQVGEFERRTKIACSLRVDGDQPRIDTAQATAVFRIVQESLTNVARHGRASRAEVCVGRECGRLIVRVRDDGCGLSEDSLATSRSLGILGMRERAAAAGGTLSISTAPNRGTVVTVQVPLPPTIEHRTGS